MPKPTFARPGDPRVPLRVSSLLGAFTFSVALCAPLDAQTTAPAAEPPPTGADAQPSSETRSLPARGEVEGNRPRRTAAQGEDVTTLSPFEVMADNKGYRASSTASGTRLNSNLADLASPITVITKQQLEDLAAVDINDIFRTEANVEGLFQYSEYSFDRGQVVDTASNNPENNNRIRGMGAANITVNGVSRSGAIPIDVYNVESVEIARGANSNIFGIGSTSGTVNLNTASANTSRDINKVTAQVDSFEGYRGSYDFNRVLVRDKLAVRALGVYADAGFTRQPAEDITRGLTLAARAQPFKNTSIKASFETYRNKQTLPNRFMPREAITDWQNRGGYTWDPSTYTVYDRNNQPVRTYLGTQNGTAQNGSLQLFNQFGFINGDVSANGGDTANQRPTMGIINGAPAYFTSTTAPLFQGSFNATSGVANYANANQRLVQLIDPSLRVYVPEINPATGQPYGLIVSLLDQIPAVHGANAKDFYDWENVNLSSANRANKASDTFRFQVEQFLLNTSKNQIAVQFGGVYEKVHNKSYAFIGNGADGANSMIHVDINRVLPDGSPNPGYMRPYVRGRSPQFNFRPEDNYTEKVQVAYLTDFTGDEGWTRWFGRHNFLGYGEERMNRSGQIRYNSRIVDFTPILRARGNQDTINTRYYLGDPVGYNLDSPSTPPPVGGTIPYTYWSTSHEGPGIPQTFVAPAQWRTADTTFDEAYLAATGVNQRRVKTLGAIWQGFFLDGRIVPVLGYREDMIRFKSNIPFNPTAQPLYDPIPDLFNFSENFIITDYRTGATKNRGATRTAGVVIKPLRWLNLTYNQSSSFDPVGLAVDTYGDVLPNPSGESKDYGVRVTLWEDRLWLSVNRYEANQKNARNGSAGVLGSRAAAFDFDTGDTDPDNGFGGITSGTQQDLYDWYFYRIWGNTSVDAAGQPAFNGTGDPAFLASKGFTTPAQVSAYVFEIMGVDKEQIRKSNNVPAGTTRTAPNDVTSKGTEVELNYRSRDGHFNLKMAGAEKQAIDDNISASLVRYLEERRPVWEAASYTNQTTGTTESFWKTTFSGSGTATREARFYSLVYRDYSIITANLGKSRPQLRRYTANAIASYDLAGISDNKVLSAIRTGASVGWASKAALGYGYAEPELDPDTRTYIIRQVDPDKIFYDKARYTADVWASYDFRMFSGRIRSRLQFNVKNLLEEGRLQAVGVNSDGGGWNYRIIDPRQYILSLTMDL